MAEHDKEALEFLKKRLRELAAESASTFSYRFTGFLSPSEAALGLAAAAAVYGRGGTYPKGVAAFGGTDGCERVMLRFGDAAEIGYDVPFPIRIVHAQVPAQKFTDTLTHRDYLGALMNLGIKRDTVGDIRLFENAAWIFAEDQIAEYIAENLTRVKHTAVRCELCETVPAEAAPRTETVKVITPSARLDAVLAKLLHLSRGKAKELFSRREVFVNGLICENESMEPKEGDVISVRGYGKCIYRGINGATRKGSAVIELERYL